MTGHPALPSDFFLAQPQLQFFLDLKIIALIISTPLFSSYSRPYRPFHLITFVIYLWAYAFNLCLSFWSLDTTRSCLISGQLMTKKNTPFSVRGCVSWGGCSLPVRPLLFLPPSFHRSHCDSHSRWHRSHPRLHFLQFIPHHSPCYFLSSTISSSGAPHLSYIFFPQPHLSFALTQTGVFSTFSVWFFHTLWGIPSDHPCVQSIIS